MFVKVQGIDLILNTKKIMYFKNTQYKINYIKCEVGCIKIQFFIFIN